MKIYQKPVTEIELSTQCYLPILASPGGVSGTLDNRIGLPIFGDALVDPGFNSSSSFSSYSVWDEEEGDEEAKLF